MNQICQKYDLSIFTAKKIIKEFKSNVKRAEIYSTIRCKKMILSPKVKIWISEYIKSASERFTSLDIHKHIQKKLSVSIPRNQIWKYLKHSEKLSYKKGSARPYTLDVNKLKLTKQLFWVKLAQNLHNIKLLINLDESTANNDTKNSYSWLQTGKHWSINSIVFRGSVNFISCIATDGWAISLLKYRATNGEMLIKFLKFIFKYLKEQDVSPREIGIILDNCAIHRAKRVKDYCRSIGVSLYYLPAYCPELVPIELYFSRLKANMIENIEQQIDLKSDAALPIISRCIQAISKEWIQKLWQNFFSSVRNEIEKTRIHNA